MSASPFKTQWERLSPSLMRDRVKPLGWCCSLTQKWQARCGCPSPWGDQWGSGVIAEPAALVASALVVLLFLSANPVDCSTAT